MKKELVEKLDLYLLGVWSSRELANYALGILAETQVGILEVPGDFVVESLERISRSEEVDAAWIREVRREITGRGDPNPLERIAWKRDNPHGLIQLFHVREPRRLPPSRSWYNALDGCFECRIETPGRYARTLSTGRVEFDLVDSWMPSALTVDCSLTDCIDKLPRSAPLMPRPATLIFQAHDAPELPKEKAIHFDPRARTLHVAYLDGAEAVSHALCSHACFDLDPNMQLVGFWLFNVAEQAPSDLMLGL
jgi:hypothetical protein